MILSSLTDELWQNTKPRIQINCCSWVYREFLFWRQLSNSLLGSSSSAKSASNFKISAHSGRFCLLTEHEKKPFYGIVCIHSVALFWHLFRAWKKVIGTQKCTAENIAVHVAIFTCAGKWQIGLLCIAHKLHSPPEARASVKTQSADALFSINRGQPDLVPKLAGYSAIQSKKASQYYSWETSKKAFMNRLGLWLGAALILSVRS